MASDTARRHSVVIERTSTRLFPTVRASVWSVGVAADKGCVRLDHLVGGRFKLIGIIVKGRGDVTFTDANTGTVKHLSELKLGTPLDYPMHIHYTPGLEGVWFELLAGTGQMLNLKVA